MVMVVREGGDSLLLKMLCVCEAALSTVTLHNSFLQEPFKIKAGGCKLTVILFKLLHLKLISGEGRGISSVIDVCTQLTVAAETASGYRGD